MDGKQKRPGFVNSKHVFGRSAIVRNGNQLYYLKWQWTKDKTVDDIIYLTPKQYQHIKKMLISDAEETVHEISDISSEIVYHHATDAKHYMRIKRYLVRNKLLKGK